MARNAKTVGAASAVIPPHKHRPAGRKLSLRAIQGIMTTGSVRSKPVKLKVAPWEKENENDG